MIVIGKHLQIARNRYLPWWKEPLVKELRERVREEVNLSSK